MKIIHVNNQVIRHNKKYDNTLPACRVQEGSTVRYCKEVIIKGDSKLVYRPENPLKCGAKLWIETDADVELVGEISYMTIKSNMESLTNAH
jgi:hypothetical protein